MMPNLRYRVSIIQCLKDGDQVYFITNNSKDFFEGNELHGDLKKEIKAHSETNDRFGIFNDVKSFFTAIVHPKLEIIDSIKDKFISNTLDGIDTNQLLKQVEDGVENLDIGNLLPDNNDHSSYQIIGHSIELGEIDDVWLLDDSDCYINYFYECTLNVEYFVDKFEAYGNEFTEYAIVDDDWNDHVVLVSISLEVKIAASLIYNTIEKTEVQFEFELSP